MVAGVVVSILFFYIALVMTGQPGLAFLAGMSYNLNLAQLFFEANLLSETVSALGVAAVTATIIAVHRRRRQRRRTAVVLLLLGILAGVTVLTRPQFVFLPLLVGAIVVYAWLRHDRSRVRLGLGNATIAVVPGVALVVGWCAFNYAHVGFFTLSTQTGIGLMDQTLAFVELAPDRYATIRDIYVRYRDAQLATSGNYRGVIWEAVPELRAATGLSLPALSHELQRMSVGLFLTHPERYAPGVMHGWIDFWLVPNYWQLDRVRPAWLQPVLRGIWRAEHLVLRLANVAFLVVVMVIALSPRVRRRTRWDLDLFSIAAIILLAATVQALAEYGENARFAVPVQGMVVLFMMVVGARWGQTRRQDEGSMGP